jgi:hypothetical protein
MAVVVVVVVLMNGEYKEHCLLFDNIVDDSPKEMGHV